MSGPRQIRDGEWFTPLQRGHTNECCNCGLVHRMQFRVRGPDRKIARHHTVEWSLTRDRKATRAARRRRDGLQRPR